MKMIVQLFISDFLQSSEMDNGKASCAVTSPQGSPLCKMNPSTLFFLLIQNEMTSERRTRRKSKASLSFSFSIHRLSMLMAFVGEIPSSPSIRKLCHQILIFQLDISATSNGATDEEKLIKPLLTRP